MEIIHPQKFRAGIIRLHILPIIVWLVSVACVIGLFMHRAQRFEVLGLAQGQVRQIAATTTGRLKSVPVELFDHVRKDQILAVLDDEQLQAQLAVISAEIQRLTAELVPTQEQLLTDAANNQNDRAARLRRFSIDVENARLRILELKTLIETDRILAQDSALEVKIVIELLKENAVTEYDLQKAQLQHDALARKIEVNENLLAQAEKDLTQAQLRLEEVKNQQPFYASVDSALEAIHKAIEVQEKHMEELMVQSKALVLKSPFDGIVSQIQYRLGEAVMPGEPILTVAQTKPREIIAYANEKQLDNVKEKMVVKLIKNTYPQQIASSQIIHVGPTIELMPERLWQRPDMPKWGRPILIKIPPGMELAPGEMVGIKGL